LGKFDKINASSAQIIAWARFGAASDIDTIELEGAKRIQAVHRSTEERLEAIKQDAQRQIMAIEAEMKKDVAPVKEFLQQTAGQPSGELSEKTAKLVRKLKTGRKPRKMSAAARKAASKRMTEIWAMRRSKKASEETRKLISKSKTGKPRKLSAAGRKRISDAQKRRWAEARLAQSRPGPWRAKRGRNRKKNGGKKAAKSTKKEGGFLAALVEGRGYLSRQSIG
jgi:hypothetical protein